MGRRRAQSDPQHWLGQLKPYQRSANVVVSQIETPSQTVPEIVSHDTTEPVPFAHPGRPDQARPSERGKLYVQPPTDTSPVGNTQRAIGDIAPKAISELTLTARLSLFPDLGIWAVAVLLTAFAVYYSWNASLSSTPSTILLWNTPDNTVFTIGLLSYLSMLFVNYLITSTCDYVKWHRSCKGQGIPSLSFLALSSQTSICGLIHLLFSPFPSIKPSTFLSIGHRLWALQRFIFSILVLS